MNPLDGTAPPDRPARSTRTRQWAAKGGLVAAGLLAGGLIAGTISANAATPAAAPSTSAGTEAPGNSGGPRNGAGLGLSGTVTAVGSSSVTIRTSSGTTEYAVSGSSDIDKNGEAQLSDLVVGDAVTFSVTSDGKTIDKLHSGDESRNRPSGPPAGSGGGPEGGTTTG